MNEEVTKSEQMGEGESPARAGETARQLIRRAKREIPSTEVITNLRQNPPGASR
jgi:hypothetical protein